jgi:methionyl aminopeptidase
VAADHRQLIPVKTADELSVMHRANQIVAGVLNLLEEQIYPGITTRQLDEIADDYCRAHGAEAAFKGYHGFPASLCISINEQIVHGIPSSRVQVREGDIVSIDFGTRYQGFFGDAAVTIPVGTVSLKKLKLIQVASQALENGIKQVQIGNRIADVSKAIQHHVEANHFTVVRQFVGHGIGCQLHEEPEVPNFVDNSKPSPRIVEGMVIAIEPMVNAGTPDVRILKDGWTVITADRMPSAHFEHSVAATVDGPFILSRRRD